MSASKWAASRKRLIVYDLDGTLVDTLVDIAAAANHMLDQLVAPRLEAEEIRRYVGRGLHEVVKHCLKTDDARRIEQGTKVYRAYYSQHLLDHSSLYPGATEVLKYFAARRQAVITNKPDPYSRDILAALGVSKFFFSVIAGNSAYPRKPDPTALFTLMQQTGATPQDTLLVGDSEIDVQTGRNAGVLTVVLCHGLARPEELRRVDPDVMVGDFAQLLTLAKKRRW